MNAAELEGRAAQEYLLIKRDILQQQQQELQREWVEAEAKYGRLLGRGIAEEAPQSLLLGGCGCAWWMLTVCAAVPIYLCGCMLMLWMDAWVLRLDTSIQMYLCVFALRYKPLSDCVLKINRLPLFMHTCII